MSRGNCIGRHFHWAPRRNSRLEEIGLRVTTVDLEASDLPPGRSMQLPADSIPIIEGISIYKVFKSLSHISLKITGHGNHDLHKGAELWFSDWLAPITAVLLISDGENITLKISRAARAGSPGEYEHKIAAKFKHGDIRHYY